MLLSEVVEPPLCQEFDVNPHKQYDPPDHSYESGHAERVVELIENSANAGVSDYAISICSIFLILQCRVEACSQKTKHISRKFNYLDQGLLL
jgi:hypothetical protein